MHDSDGRYMGQALRLAEQGLCTASPNPRVGCVIVTEDGTVAGEGFHRRTGEAHAETQALARAGARSTGATMYVTLEPCAHHGHTPPCTDAIVAAGIRRLVSACEDPDPRVRGRGHEALRRAGVECDTGVREEEARALNRGFFRRVGDGRPWVCIKQAASLDGCSALADGRSQWISSEEARADVQRLRARSCAVLSTARTVARDGARLNVRMSCEDLGIDEVRQPLRVVLDRSGDSDASWPVWAAPGTCVAYTRAEHVERLRRTLPGSVQVQATPASDGGLDLAAVLDSLAGDHEVNEVLVEAGARLSGALISLGHADELVLYIAPRLLGTGAMPVFDLPQADDLPARTDWILEEARSVGPDLRVRWRYRGP